MPCSCMEHGQQNQTLPQHSAALSCHLQHHHPATMGSSSETKTTYTHSQRALSDIVNHFSEGSEQDSHGVRTTNERISTPAAAAAAARRSSSPRSSSTPSTRVRSSSPSSIPSSALPPLGAAVVPARTPSSRWRLGESSLGDGKPTHDNLCIICGVVSTAGARPLCAKGWTTKNAKTLACQADIPQRPMCTAPLAAACTANLAGRQQPGQDTSALTVQRQGTGRVAYRHGRTRTQLWLGLERVGGGLGAPENVVRAQRVKVGGPCCTQAPRQQVGLVKQQHRRLGGVQLTRIRLQVCRAVAQRVACVQDL